MANKAAVPLVLGRLAGDGAREQPPQGGGGVEAEQREILAVRQPPSSQRSGRNLPRLDTVSLFVENKEEQTSIWGERGLGGGQSRRERTSLQQSV